MDRPGRRTGREGRRDVAIPRAELVVLVDEDAYVADREEQLVQRLVRAGHTRREILKRGAVGAFLLAGVGRLVCEGAHLECAGPGRLEGRFAAR
jgi:hypothetical protein